MAFDIEIYLSSRKKLIDRKLSELILATNKSMSRLEESMRYSILAGGKRLRPILCLAAGESVGGTIEEILPTSCAIEMIHTYSLVHDDLPSMDDDSLRRGVPTNHSVFGEAVAILAGDALLTDAFLIIADEGIVHGLSPSLLVEVIRDISNAAGSRGMVMGQALDLALEGREEVTLDLIEEVHSLKTGALIQASVTSGARIGGATDSQLSQLSQYARFLGLSFQIIDDVLDIEGGSEIGKVTGADARRKKVTYPILVGIENAKETAQKLTEEAIFALTNFDENAEPLRQLAYYMGARTY